MAEDTDIKVVESGEEEKRLTPEAYTKSPSETPYEPIKKPKQDLSPPSAYIKPTSNDDENDPYVEFGFFNDTNVDIFIPEFRGKNGKKDKPINNMYEKKQDDTQFEPSYIVRAMCKCKDGREVLGYLDTRSGQKDCSPCKKTKKSYPNAYKNYKIKGKVKKQRPRNVPLREQIGVSHFGDVNMKGCNVDTNMTKSQKANNTLNKVVNVSQNSPKGKVITQKETKCVPNGLSLYDNCTTNLYGI